MVVPGDSRGRVLPDIDREGQAGLIGVACVDASYALIPIEDDPPVMVASADEVEFVVDLSVLRDDDVAVRYLYDALRVPVSPGPAVVGTWVVARHGTVGTYPQHFPRVHEQRILPLQSGIIGRPDIQTAILTKDHASA